MDIDVETSQTGSDLKQLSPVVLCKCATEAHKKQGKHINLRLIGDRPRMFHIFSWYPYCYSYSRGSDCSLCHWISSTNHFWISVRWAVVIHNVRQVSTHVFVCGDLCAVRLRECVTKTGRHSGKKRVKDRSVFSYNSAKFYLEHLLGVVNGDDNPSCVGRTTWLYYLRSLLLKYISHNNMINNIQDSMQNPLVEMNLYSFKYIIHSHCIAKQASKIKCMSCS